MSFLGLANLVALALLAGLTGFMFARRPAQLLWPWIVAFQLCLIAFVIGDAITKASTDLALEQAGLVLLYSGSFLGIGCWWMVTLRFAALQGLHLRLAQARFTRPVLVFAIGAWLVAATNPWHGQFLVPVVNGRYDHQAAWWVLGIGGHLLAGGTIAIYARLFAGAHSRRDRVNAALMLLAVAVPGVVNLAYAANSDWSSDPTTLAFCVSSGLFVWGTYRSGLFSLTPFALEAILRHEPAAVLVMGRGGEVLFANPAAKQLLRGGDFPALARRLRRADNDGAMSGDELSRLVAEPRPEDRKLLLRDDADRWLEAEVNAIPHRRGTEFAVALHLRDITEQRRAEAEHLEYEKQMQKAQRLESIGVLAGGVAHDFNNLLTPILVNAELGLDAVDAESPAGECFREISAVSQHAAEFVEQLVAYAGQPPRQREPIDCCAVAREMETLLVSVVGKAVPLELKLRAAPPAVSGDRAQLRQVMMNLLINAAEAQQGRDGFIELEIDTCSVTASDVSRWMLGNMGRAGRHVFIRVRDQGRGMDETTMARVLEPFFSTKATGRGLGLAAAVGIVRAHDGGLLIESEVDVGSTFTVYLPALDAPVAAVDGGVESARAGGALVAVDGDGVTALVIDDEDSVRRGAQRALESAGFAVLAADGGREALRLIDRHSAAISVVLLDACMPEMSGRDTLRAIRRLAPDLPVVITSGHQEGVRLCEESPGSASAFLPKPFTAQQVVEVVRAALPPAAVSATAPRHLPAGHAAAP